MADTIKLDVIDQKILAVLLKHGRISLTELARVIKHHYPTVRNRVYRLVDKDVIRHFYPVLQYPGIGARRYMSIYLSLKKVTKEKQQEILQKLSKHPFLIEVFELEGRWNISVLLVCNYVKEAHETISGIQRLCGTYLTDLVVMPTYTVSNLNRSFFLEIEFMHENVKTGYAHLIQETPLIHLESPLKLDKEDIALLDYIQLNARDTLEEIAEKIKVDPTTVEYKLKRFIKLNLIRYFTIEVNSDVLGYEQYLLFLNLRGSEEGKIKIIEYLKNKKEAYHYFEYLNYWEIVITFSVKKREEMHKVFADLQEHHKEYIKDHEMLWLMKKHKVHPYPGVKKIYRK